MSTRFVKVAAKRPKPHKRTPLTLKERPKTADSGAPTTRVGDCLDHHDTISNKVLYVLVDSASQDPADTVILHCGSREPTRMEYSPENLGAPYMAPGSQLTTSAEPLSDTTLVSALSFDVPDTGKFSLIVRRGSSSAVLFVDIDSTDLLAYDPDLVCQPQTEGSEFQESRRVLDYQTVQPRPRFDDQDLAQKAPPSTSLLTDESSGS